jgi:hypothetical protein
MLRKEDLKVGDHVHYQPSHYLKEDRWENGIVKVIPEFTVSSVRVVYNCGGEWDHYEDFTSAMTDCRDLNKGWRD